MFRGKSGVNFVSAASDFSPCRRTCINRGFVLLLLIDGYTTAPGDQQSASVKVWDASSGEELVTIQGAGERIDTVVFCPDGKRIASASKDHTVKIWDASTGKESMTFSGHKGLSPRKTLS